MNDTPKSHPFTPIQEDTYGKDPSFEKIKDKGCGDLNHFPPQILHMVIPPEGFDYRCPACGHITHIAGTRITY